jgi:hypothetical protein
MQPALRAFGAVILIGSAVLAQNLVPIPPHASVYNGYSRGYNFTAQSVFVIVQLNLPLDAFQVGDTAGYLVRVNGIQVLLSTGNAGAISTSIQINVGDVVDVIGNWSPVAPGSFTAHNSYGNSAPYATTIEGVPHTLNRTGWQWDIGAPAFGGTYLTPTTGAIGRVEMYTSAAGGFASKAPYGTGCYDRPRMVRETFAGNVTPIDLMNTQQTLLYTPNPNGGNYVIVQAGPAYDPVTPAASGVNLALQPFSAAYGTTWDDASSVQTLPAAQFPNGFPFPAAGGGSTTTITVNSNGKIYLGTTLDATFATQGSNYASILPFQGATGAGLPVLAPFNCDIDPTVGGALWYESPSPNGGVRITWAGIPNWQNTVAGSPLAVICDFQMELLPSGIVTFAYGPSLGTGGSAANDAIVGYSAGGGQPVTAMVDWSALSGYVSGDGSIPLTCDASARPVLGTTINVMVGNIPPATPFAAVLYGLIKFNPGISLAGIGMPGCEQYGSQDAMALGIVPGASFSTPFPIPVSTSFSGVSIVCQGAAYNPAAVPNPLGALSSNGLELILDVN